MGPFGLIGVSIISLDGARLVVVDLVVHLVAQRMGNFSDRRWGISVILVNDDFVCIGRHCLHRSVEVSDALDEVALQQRKVNLSGVLVTFDADGIESDTGKVETAPGKEVEDNQRRGDFPSTCRDPGAGGLIHRTAKGVGRSTPLRMSVAHTPRSQNKRHSCCVSPASTSDRNVIRRADLGVILETGPHTEQGKNGLHAADKTNGDVERPHRPLTSGVGVLCRAAFLILASGGLTQKVSRRTRRRCALGHRPGGSRRRLGRLLAAEESKKDGNCEEGNRDQNENGTSEVVVASTVRMTTRHHMPTQKTRQTADARRQKLDGQNEADHANNREDDRDNPFLHDVNLPCKTANNGDRCGQTGKVPTNTTTRLRQVLHHPHLAAVCPTKASLPGVPVPEGSG